MTREKALADRILVYLKEHKSLTSMQAVKLFDTTRLGARIFDLRERGYKIATIMTYGTDPVTKEKYKYGTYVFQGEVDGYVSKENGGEWELVQAEVKVSR